jgi:hypothetical protein
MGDAADTPAFGFHLTAYQVVLACRQSVSERPRVDHFQARVRSAEAPSNRDLMLPISAPRAAGPATASSGAATKSVNQRDVRASPCLIAGSKASTGPVPPVISWSTPGTQANRRKAKASDSSTNGAPIRPRHVLP